MSDGKAPAAWHPDPHNPGVERYWDGSEWTELRRPAASSAPRRRRGGTVMKVALGVVLGGVLLIAGCAALIGGAANEAVKELDAEQERHAITKQAFDSAKLGWSEQRLIEHVGKQPEDKQEFTNEGFLDEEPSESSCIYFNRTGGEFGDAFQFCFDDGRLSSKNAY